MDDFHLEPADLRMYTYRSGEASGANVSGLYVCRIIHLPTGISAESAAETTQYKNMIKALELLKAAVIRQRKSQDAND